VPSILDRFHLTGRVAVVTGASRGIGAAIALAFAEAGADVVVAARSEDALDAVVGHIKEGTGRDARRVAADLNDLAALPALVDTARDAFGRIDILVNNVGGTAPRPFLDTSPGYMERAFHFNVTVAFELTRLAVPHLLAAGGGSVINISSAMGRFADRGFVAYGTAKAALEHMTQLVAADLSPRIRVNAIAPGSIETAALASVLDDRMRTTMVGNTPLGRLGDVADIAAAAVFLASDAGSFLTGKVLEVDGGLRAPNLPLGLPDLT
jgi:7-alpha-hydroxysteroid dehydrogenase